MIDISKDYIEVTSTHDAALVQTILEEASYAYRMENTTVHLNYTYYPDVMSQEEIAESRRRKKEFAITQEEELSSMSRKELKQLMRDPNIFIVDENPEMDVWAVRFFIEEKDNRFLETLENQVGDLRDRVNDKLYPDQQLHTRFYEIHEKYEELSKQVDHPYEDVTAYYPFVYKTPSNPNLEPFKPRTQVQFFVSVTEE